MIGRRAFTRGIPVLAAALALVALGGCHVHGHAGKHNPRLVPPGKHWQHRHHGPPRHRHHSRGRHRDW